MGTAESSLLENVKKRKLSYIRHVIMNWGSLEKEVQCWELFLASIIEKDKERHGWTVSQHGQSVLERTLWNRENREQWRGMVHNAVSSWSEEGKRERDRQTDRLPCEKQMFQLLSFTAQLIHFKVMQTRLITVNVHEGCCLFVCAD